MAKPERSDRPAISVRPFADDDQVSVARIFHDVMLTRYTEPENQYHTPWRVYAAKRLRTDLADIEGAYVQPGGNFWVAVATSKDGQQRIAGIIGLERKDENVGEVRSVFVDVDHHRLGVGRALMTALIEWAKTHSFSQLFLTTTAENNQSRGFYESMGFHFEPHSPPLTMAFPDPTAPLLPLAKYVHDLQ